MPGFDRNRIVGLSDEVLDEFTCGLCQQIFVNPVSTQCCGQSYCQQCIETWLTLNKVCPNDRQPMSQWELIQSPKFITNLLTSMKVKCDYHMNGCQEIVPMSELFDHVLKCRSAPKSLCKTCGHEENDYEIGHNCIRTLLEKNSAKNEENNRLEEEIRKLKHNLSNVIVENQNLMLNNVAVDLYKSIESARNRLDICTIIQKSNSITNEMSNTLIEKCKDAIMRENTFTSIAEHIVDNLKTEKSAKRINWSVVVNQFNTIGLKCSQHYYLYIRFDSLALTLMGFK